MTYIQCGFESFSFFSRLTLRPQSWGVWFGVGWRTGDTSRSESRPSWHRWVRLSIAPEGPFPQYGVCRSHPVVRPSLLWLSSWLTRDRDGFKTTYIRDTSLVDQGEFTCSPSPIVGGGIVRERYGKSDVFLSVTLVLRRLHLCLLQSRVSRTTSRGVKYLLFWLWVCPLPER